MTRFLVIALLALSPAFGADQSDDSEATSLDVAVQNDVCGTALAPKGRRYLLVTPVRNEAAHLRTTLDTTLAQTVPPARWVIVDDGSTDETPQILAEYAAKHKNIKVVTRTDRGRRAVGPGVIEAFFSGLRDENLDDYDYITKYDGDVEMPPRYFERAMEHMEADPFLGNISGKMMERQPDGSLLTFFMGDENAIGAIKFYRMSCFREIGGFVQQVAWDGIDGHICRLNGWVAASVTDPEMRFIHLRPMGSSEGDIINGRRRWGRGKYFMGSSWYYVAAASLFRMKDRPYVRGGLEIMRGYLQAARDGMPRYDNPRYIRQLRRFELLQLLLGKSRGTQVMNEWIRRFGPRANRNR